MYIDSNFNSTVVPDPIISKMKLDNLHQYPTDTKISSYWLSRFRLMLTKICNVTVSNVALVVVISRSVTTTVSTISVIQSDTHDLLLTFHSNDRFRTVSEINGDFRRNSHENRQLFPLPVYLTPPLKGFPLELCIGAGVRRN